VVTQFTAIGQAEYQGVTDPVAREWLAAQSELIKT
jgi:hypothetical protein